MTSGTRARPDSEALVVENLAVSYRLRGADLAVVHEASLTVQPGELLGVVGESGSGKSTLGLALLRLLPSNGRITQGSIRLGGRDLTALSAQELRQVRGRLIAPIFQDPTTTLNPTFTVGAQLREVLRAHPSVAGRGRRQLERRAIDFLEQVGIPDAAERLRSYPFELSGGMRQRVTIAMALMLEPRVIVADEPTSALDVTLQAQILRLLRELCEEHQTGIMLISHDLGAVAEVCDHIVVMYGGWIVERGPVDAVLHHPLHPYTVALLESVPSYQRRNEPLTGIEGQVPALSDFPSGCPFAGRCRFERPVCTAEVPREVQVDAQGVRCMIHDVFSDYGSPPDEMRRRRQPRST